MHLILEENGGGKLEGTSTIWYCYWVETREMASKKKILLGGSVC